MPGFSIMYWRLLIMAAVRSSPPPAGISGWCMCSAIANALRARSKSMPLSCRNSGLDRAACKVRSTSDSAPAMFGRPSIISSSSGMRPPRLLVTDIVVNVQIVLGRMVPRVVVAHRILRERAELAWVMVPKPDRPLQRRLDRKGIGLVEHVAVALVHGTIRVVAVEHGVNQTA